MRTLTRLDRFDKDSPAGEILGAAEIKGCPHGTVTQRQFHSNGDGSVKSRSDRRVVAGLTVPTRPLVPRALALTSTEGEIAIMPGTIDR